MQQLSGKVFAVMLAGCVLPHAVPAEDVVSSHLLGLELARDIAQGAIDACRKQGY